MLVEALHGALRDNVSFLDVLIWSMDFIIGQPTEKRKIQHVESTKRILSFFYCKK